MKKIALASVAFVGLATAASANLVDTVNKSGFYVGINGGYGFGKSKNTLANGAKVNVKPKGGLYGIHTGYQHDLGRSVVGLELHGLMTEQKGKKTTPANAHIKSKRDYGYGVSARMGYKVAPCWVAGIKLGYERAKYLNHFTDSANVGHKKSVKLNGFVPGIYAEKLLNKRWMVGLEYSYAMFKKHSYTSTGAKKITVKPTSNDFKVRLGYKF